MKRIRLFVLVVGLACGLGAVSVTQAAQAGAAPRAEGKQGQTQKAPAAQSSKQAAAKPSKASVAAKRAREKKARRKALQSKAVATPVAKAPLDLSIPREMVKELEPAVGNNTPKHKTLLPAMFPENPSQDSAFQLNGRLISNEMQLQLRNDSQRDVEGAAIEFQFRQ
ncbi:hypothetical protein [Pseudomonas entomophila]|uniref:hypothetical protein n=1 Tax=Pseudomonas entomophila TaxID=312306 RepID=UPI003EBA7FE7